jgi:predicted metal-dependent phosphotriesterase family hydrolase
MLKSFSRRQALEFLGAAAAVCSLPKSAGAALELPKGAVIRTVLKDYAPEDLADGATLFHEHMSLKPDFMTRWMGYARATREANGDARPAATPPTPAVTPPATPPAQASGTFFMRDEELMAEEMKQAKSEGIACIVDGGHADMGRDISFLKAISSKSGLPIVAGGGFYTQPFYPEEVASWSETQIFDALMKQVDTEPIGVFGEIGSWDYMTKDERKVFRAVGRAQAATNLPIFTHTGIPGKSALEQLDLLEDAGAKAEHIVIGHVGNLVDPKVEIQKALCRRGCFIGFDRQGGPGDQQQVPMVMALIEAGFANNLMFSADLSSLQQTKHGGGAGYAKTLTVFVPKIKQAGASDEVLHTIMVDNPRRFLAFVPKRPRKG